MDFAPALIVGVIVVPAIGAATLATFRVDRLGWPVAATSLSVTFLVSMLLAVTLVAGPAEYRLGPSPGIVFRSDLLSATIGLLDVLLTLGILAYTPTAGPHSWRFYLALLLFTTAVFGVVLAGDLVVVYAFLLVLIWSTARLVESGDKQGSERAATAYRQTAGVGATVYLIGVLLAVSQGGTTDGQRLGATLRTVGHTEPVVVASFVFSTIGLALLMALIPLHGWLVETHATSDDPVSALISGVLPAVAIYPLARLLFDVYTVDFLAANPAITSGMIYGALVSLIAGNLLAYGQRDIKGILAYSTVAQFGLILTGFTVATETAVFGAMIQLFGHGIVKGALCLIAGIVAIRFNARTIEEFAGLAERAPVVAVAFAGLGIAMIGLPPTVGFVGKWYIALGALETGNWLVAGAVAVSTLLTLGYVVPFIDRIYFGSFEGVDAGFKSVSRRMVATVVLAVLIAFAIGLASVFLEALLREAIVELVAVPEPEPPSGLD